MKISAIPIFSDNYVWLLSEGSDAAVVDPGDAGPVVDALQSAGLALRAILITHWHPDHIGGVSALLEKYPVPVYGPRAEAQRIPLLTEPLAEGDRVSVLSREFSVLETPGHTLGHIAYLSGDILFCGDTLFSAGCGRLFEGTPGQLHASLNRLAALPPQTKVYCTHEYTAANLKFALAAEPGNASARTHAAAVDALRAAGLPSLPSGIGLELAINPFLRCDEPALRAAAQREAGRPLNDAKAVFAALRQWKDTFRS